MRFVADSKDVAAAVKVIGAACPTRTPTEVLQTIKVAAADDAVLMAATDNIQSVCQSVEGASVLRDGECLLPAKQFSQIASVVNGEMTVESKGSKVIVSCGDDKFSINTFDAGTHPARFDMMAQENYGHIMLRAELLDALQKTVFATNENGGRFAMGGVAFDLSKDGSVVLVATDGARMSVCEIQGASRGGHYCIAENTVVPVHSIKVLLGALRVQASDRADVTITANAAVVTVGSFSFSARLVEGRFPPYRRLMPDTSNEEYMRMMVNPHLLVSGARKSAILSDVDSIGVNFTFGQDKIVMKREVGGAGASEVVVEASGGAVESEMKLDPNKMREWLACVQNGGEVELYYPVNGFGKLVMRSGNSTFLQMAMVEGQGV